jgi:hypothetical protein
VALKIHSKGGVEEGAPEPLSDDGNRYLAWHREGDIPPAIRTQCLACGWAGALDLGRVAFLVPQMATLKSEHPLLAVRARDDRSGWFVEAWWTNRPSENIGHFATQSEARNWITLESTSYFVLREIESMIKHQNNG